MPDTPDHTALAIRVEEPLRSRIVIGLKGEVDLSNAQELEDAIDSACKRRAEAIIVDLKGLEFIDSTGLRVLVERTRRSRENGGRFQVRGATGQVLRILEVAGIYEWLITEAEGDTTGQGGSP